MSTITIQNQLHVVTVFIFSFYQEAPMHVAKKKLNYKGTMKCLTHVGADDKMKSGVSDHEGSKATNCAAWRLNLG